MFPSGPPAALLILSEEPWLEWRVDMAVALAVEEVVGTGLRGRPRLAGVAGVEVVPEEAGAESEGVVG